MKMGLTTTKNQNMYKVNYKD